MRKIKDKLNTTIKTGKVVLGSRNVLHSLLVDNPKMIIMSRNCSKETREAVAYYTRLTEVLYTTVDENSMELGFVCGKPYSISAIAIIDSGDSDILG